MVVLLNASEGTTEGAQMGLPDPNWYEGRSIFLANQLRSVDTGTPAVFI